MASLVASIPSITSLHNKTTSSSSAGYFDFDPSTYSEDAIIQSTMEHSQVLRMDAFHYRKSDSFAMPENVHLYIARPLPALPIVAHKSPRRLVIPESRRPSLTSDNRAATTDCVERPLPPLPLRTSTCHRRGISIESIASSRLSESDIISRRPRNMRSTSFKQFFKAGGTSSQPSPTESVRTTSSLSEHSDCDSRHDSILIDDMGLSLSKTTTPASSAPGSRRPSTLSLASLRSRKISQESNSLPSRPVSARKNSQSAGGARRWNIFGADKIAPIEDEENIPPVPCTPVSTTEMSCHRCHYYSLRNCNGWVMGGAHGDACESCTMHGFFGSP